jgi:hypothetical protein
MSGREFPEGDEDGEFAPEVGETGQADAGEGRGDEERGEHGGLLRETAHFIHREGVRAVVDRGREQEEERDGEAVGNHEQHDAAGPMMPPAAMPRNA